MTRLLACAAFLVFLLLAWAARDHPTLAGARWDAGDPPVAVGHIFEGEINRAGRPGGFHHRPDGRDLANARLARRLAGPNDAGIYTGRVEIRRDDSAPWQEKFSSFFPDRLARDEVLALIRRAFRAAGTRDGRKWRGPSGHGFEIEGWIDRQGRIVTAYPLYRAGP
ncbi:EndoU domain-containing protein [Oceanibacterium hippocampi]|uniref:Ribonuclease n=1 Tax=Oceanibacterium hippocampi TaxID=745714 RepID=A0A1Y5TY72_9PROT|nr:EndoU domain-containing protein [Oceanibacterium hippocampi]SLN76783.1 Ribonuclease [Oceanibacterium hippocampi]